MGLIVVQAIAGLIAGVIAIGAGVYLLRAGRTADGPGALERGRVPIYTERGGARFDGLNWTMPFVRIAVYEDSVAISCATHEILLRKGDVTGIVRDAIPGRRGQPSLFRQEPRGLYHHDASGQDDGRARRRRAETR